MHASVLLEGLVIACALTGALSGLLALALYLVDRRMVRQTMAEGRAFLQKAKAALDIPAPDGKPLPPLQAAVSLGSSVLVNAAYALVNDPELMAKAKPLLMQALPELAEAYGRGQASAEPVSPGTAMNKLRWPDRGGALKAVKQVANKAGLGGPMAKLQEWLPLIQAAKEFGILDKVLGGQVGAGGNGGTGPQLGGQYQASPNSWRPPM